jgi:hypothetical protein
MVWFDDEDDTPESACFIPIFVDGPVAVQLRGLLLARIKETEQYRRVGYVLLLFESKQDVIERLESLERRIFRVIEYFHLVETLSGRHEVAVCAGFCCGSAHLRVVKDVVHSESSVLFKYSTAFLVTNVTDT